MAGTKDFKMIFSIGKYDINIAVRCGLPGNRRNWKFIYEWDRNDQQAILLYVLGWR